jgi:rRNA-processing protein FCF1
VTDDAGAPDRTPPPTAEAWASLPADSWGAVLVAVRTELAAAESITAQARSVLERPTSRLVAGRGRQHVIDLLVADPRLGATVVATLADIDRAHLAPTVAPEDDDVRARAGDRAADEERLRARVRRLRGERDEWQRRAAGAQARVGQLERDLATLQQDVQDRGRAVEALERTLGQAGQERDRAVQRERRRRDAEVARLEEQVAQLRRAEEERRAAARRRAAAEEREAGRTDPVAPEPAAVARLAPGRPTRLPTHVAPDTTEAVRLLLGPGRLVLIDGYNVTRAHRADLDLEGQRTWLLQRCVTAAAALRLRPVVVFDGQRAAAARPTVARRQVEVRFTPAGITADDELVLAVEATDEPVVVVTDDRELRERVRASGADVVGTTAFLGVVGR